MTDEQLDELHRIKRLLSRKQGKRVTLDDLLHRGVELVLDYYRTHNDSGAEVQS